MLNGKVACNFDICVGTGDATSDVPDCVFLKGLSKSNVKLENNNVNNFDKPILAAIIGCLGRFTGSTGLAEIFPKGNTDASCNPFGAVVELDASVYPYSYDGERIEVPLPPVTSMVPP